MSPERIIYRTEGSDMAEIVDRIDFCSQMSLPDFLEAASRCSSSIDFRHVNCLSPGRNAHVGILVGKLKMVVSDGWISSFGKTCQFNGKSYRYFLPIFEGANYVAHVKAPLEFGEWPQANNKLEGREIFIISKYNSVEIKRMFTEAGIDTSNLRCDRVRYF